MSTSAETGWKMGVFAQVGVRGHLRCDTPVKSCPIVKTSAFFPPHPMTRAHSWSSVRTAQSNIHIEPVCGLCVCRLRVMPMTPAGMACAQMEPFIPFIPLSPRSSVRRQGVRTWPRTCSMMPSTASHKRNPTWQRIVGRNSAPTSPTRRGSSCFFQQGTIDGTTQALEKG